MKKIRLSFLFALVAALVCGFLLFVVSQKVQTNESELRKLTEARDSEEETIRVLRAEWDYLNRPDRLEALAKDYLHMTPARASQMRDAGDEMPQQQDGAVPAKAPDPVTSLQPSPVSMTTFKSGLPVPPVKPKARPASAEGAGFNDVLKEYGGQSP